MSKSQKKGERGRRGGREGGGGGEGGGENYTYAQQKTADGSSSQLILTCM